MSSVYNKGKYFLMTGGNFAEGQDDLRMLLVSTTTGGGYTFDNNHNFVSEVSATEFSDASYSRKTLTTQAVTEDDTNDWAKFTSDAVTWTALTGDTAKAAIIYLYDTSDAAAQLICYLDGADFPITANGGDVTVTPHANGWLTLG